MNLSHTHTEVFFGIIAQLCKFFFSSKKNKDICIRFPIICKQTQNSSLRLFWNVDHFGVVWSTVIMVLLGFAIFFLKSFHFFVKWNYPICTHMTVWWKLGENIRLWLVRYFYFVSKWKKFDFFFWFFFSFFMSLWLSSAL